MTVFGSTCTRPLIDRTLICNAILYHFQITLFCGRINRPSSHLHFFSSRAHLSNSSLFVSATSSRNMFRHRPVTRPQRFMLPRKLQSRYRRHLFTLNFFFKSLARDDLLINFLVSVFTPYKNFTSVRIQSRKNVLETNIVVTSRSNPTHLSPPSVFSALASSLQSTSLRSLLFSLSLFLSLSETTTTLF